MVRNNSASSASALSAATLGSKATAKSVDHNLDSGTKQALDRQMHMSMLKNKNLNR